jgi:hypothetical protein
MTNLTQKQKLQVLNFFNTQVNDTMGIVQTCYDEDKTWERQYDATCIINALYNLSSKYNARGYTFTADDIDSELANLDTEYRDIVYEAFLRELPEAITRAVFETTWDEYCEASRRQIESGVFA